MEKLKLYNQKLLAVILTLLLGFLMLLVLGSGVAFVWDLLKDSRRGIDENVVLATEDEEANEGLQKVVTKEVSFESPKIIDSLNQLYIIPVTQVNIKANNDEARVEEAVFSSYLSKKLSYGRRYQGVYNNIIFYDQLKDTKIPLFTDRVNINSFQNIEVDNIHYLFIDANKKDTNNDGTLSSTDLGSLFVYNFNLAELKEYTLPSKGFLDYHLTLNTLEIMVSFGSDLDENGQFNRNEEPLELSVVKLNKNGLKPLIDNKLRAELQEIVN